MKTQLQPQRHLVIGLSGPTLTVDEERFLRRVRPTGIIFFSRNIDTPRQFGALIAAVRETAQPPPTLWIDQEGGRVQRLRDPFTRFPSPLSFSHLARRQPKRALALAHLAGQVNAMELAHFGIGVNCAPVLDILETDADPVIGERAFGDTPETVIRFARAWLDGFQGRGVLAMGKHFPGHGAAQVDSHVALPVVYKGLSELERREFVPFRVLMPRLTAFMTAHLITTDLDPEQPATCSRPIIQGVLRDTWEFDGLVISDALEMGALSGTLAERAERSIAAGCDVILCCTGRLEDGAAALEGLALGLEKLPARERQRSGQRIERHLTGFRPIPEQTTLLPPGPLYRRARQQLEALADMAPEPDIGGRADPTEPIRSS